MFYPPLSDSLAEQQTSNLASLGIAVIRYACTSRYWLKMSFSGNGSTSRIRSDQEFVQGVLAQLPWYHQIALLDKLKTEKERRWYAQKTIIHN